MNARVLPPLVVLFSFAALCGCGGRDWKSRLQERFAKNDVDHPLTRQALESHERALEAEGADRQDDAKLWALAADRFLSAAVVSARSAKLASENNALSAQLKTLTTDVGRLEAQLVVRFEQRKAQVREQWIEDAKEAAYTHAEEYEKKRFRSRNQSTAQLKQAQAELSKLARLQLEGARALDRDKPFDDLADALQKCSKDHEPIAALDCVNQARWRIQEAFSKARRRHGLTDRDTARLKALLETNHLPVRWQNDALAIVDDGLPVAALRRVLGQTKGPVQAHGPRAGLTALQRKLRAAELPDNRSAKPTEDDSEFAVLYLLAYPRPESQSGPERMKRPSSKATRSR